MKLPGGDNVEIDQRKLTDYALSQTHPVGKHKARLFALKLGLMRDDAVHRIVDLCMTADDLKTAQILFRAIHASWILEAIQRDHPTLAQ